jgi:hypothetical protein
MGFVFHLKNDVIDWMMEEYCCLAVLEFIEVPAADFVLDAGTTVVHRHLHIQK